MKPKRTPEFAQIAWVGGSHAEAMRRMQESPALKRQQKPEQMAATLEATQGRDPKDITPEEKAAHTTVVSEMHLLLEKFKIAAFPFTPELVRALAPLLMRHVEACEARFGSLDPFMPKHLLERGKR